MISRGGGREATLRPTSRGRTYQVIASGVMGFALAASLGVGTLFFLRHPGRAGAGMLAFAVLLAVIGARFAWSVNAVFGPLVVTADERIVAFRVGPFRTRQFGRAFVSHVRRTAYTPPPRPFRKPAPMPQLQFVGLDGGVLGLLWTSFYDPAAVEAFLTAARLPVAEPEDLNVSAPPLAPGQARTGPGQG